MQIPIDTVTNGKNQMQQRTFFDLPPFSAVKVIQNGSNDNLEEKKGHTKSENDEKLLSDLVQHKEV